MERIYTDVIHSYTACPATVDAEIFHATLDMNLSIELYSCIPCSLQASWYIYSENDLYGPWIELNWDWL